MVTFGRGAVIYLVSQNVCAAVGGVPSAALAGVTAPRFFTSTPVVAAISSVSASAVSVASSVLASLPSCAPPCIDAANAALGPRGCLVGDPAYLKCICTNTDFLCPIYKCEIANCSSAELARTFAFVRSW